jgi:hypothetical protein
MAQKLQSNDINVMLGNYREVSVERKANSVPLAPRTKKFEGAKRDNGSVERTCGRALLLSVDTNITVVRYLF